MRARQRLGTSAACPLLLLAALLVTGACHSGDDTTATTTSAATAPPVTAGPVAAVDLVTGDCLAGLVIGEAERITIDNARVVSCEGAHELEVFATFALSPSEFETTPAGAYPGQERIVGAADTGCAAELGRLGVDDSRFGLIALWPTLESWAQGDRDVGCAAYASDGEAFVGRQLLAGS